MKRNNVGIGVLAALGVCLVATAVFAAQDRFTLKSPNGIAFSEFRGYETWESVAPSQTNDGIKVIVANPVMIQAYKKGIPNNGDAFPEGSMVAKIEWSKVSNPESPYPVNVPGVIKSIAFIEKNSKRFPDTNGWGYAKFDYDAASATFKPFGENASFGKNVCHQCHLAVKAKDYIFTGYPPR
jgi:Cytochrome P460